jgi:UDP-sulfoquinovose synthase
MKILILGGDGYLGWPTALSFSKKKHDVIVVDNFIKKKMELEFGFKPLIPQLSLQERAKKWNLNQDNPVKVVIGDLLNHRFVRDILSEHKPDVIVHYAEQPSAPYSMSNRERAVFTQQNNVIGNLNLLFAIKKSCPSTHLIKLGTLGEYGTPNIDIEEGWIDIEHNGRKDRMLYPKKPGSFYHLSKVHDSANIEFACRNWGLKCTDLNQGVVYGNYTDEILMDFENLSTSFHYDEVFGTIINRFLTQVITNYPLTTYGKGTQRRGFINLIDTVNCINIATNNSPKSGEFRVFNQFTDFKSVNELAEMVIKSSQKIGYKATAKSIPNPRKEMEEHYYNPKNTSLISLGLKPIVFNEEIINKNIQLISKYKKEVNKNYFRPTIKWEK